MPHDDATGMVEADTVINGHVLSFPEAMTLRVALASFLVWLADPANREALGQALAAGYIRHANARATPGVCWLALYQAGERRRRVHGD
jgi:hypothetical protein